VNRNVRGLLGAIAVGAGISLAAVAARRLVHALWWWRVARAFTAGPRKARETFTEERGEWT
jgi:hypothetical protein